MRKFLFKETNDGAILMISQKFSPGYTGEFYYKTMKDWEEHERILLQEDDGQHGQHGRIFTPDALKIFKSEDYI